jgi:hypothetical protein
MLDPMLDPMLDRILDPILDRIPDRRPSQSTCPGSGSSVTLLSISVLMSRAPDFTRIHGDPPALASTRRDPARAMSSCGIILTSCRSLQLVTQALGLVVSVAQPPTRTASLWVHPRMTRSLLGRLDTASQCGHFTLQTTPAATRTMLFVTNLSTAQLSISCPR